MAALVETLPDHLSFSQATMWLRCQRQHLFRYGMGMKVPPSGAAVVGSATHRALEHDNRVKAVRGKPEPLDVVADVYSDTFDELARDAIWEEETPAEAKDAGYIALATYHTRLSRKILPASEEAVEERVYVPLSGAGVPLLGYVDVRTPRFIADYKTTSRTITQTPDDTKLQLWIYSYALAQEGVEVKGRRVIYLVHKKEPVIVLHRVEPANPSEVARWLTALEDIRRSMEEAYQTGRFLPALPGSWWCSSRWCGYWDICHREF